jgi:hypothetical protein
VRIVIVIVIGIEERGGREPGAAAAPLSDKRLETARAPWSISYRVGPGRPRLQRVQQRGMVGGEHYQVCANWGVEVMVAAGGRGMTGLGAEAGLSYMGFGLEPIARTRSWPALRRPLPPHLPQPNRPSCLPQTPTQRPLAMPVRNHYGTVLSRPSSRTGPGWLEKQPPSPGAHLPYLLNRSPIVVLHCVTYDNLPPELCSPSLTASCVRLVRAQNRTVPLSRSSRRLPARSRTATWRRPVGLLPSLVIWRRARPGGIGGRSGNEGREE